MNNIDKTIWLWITGYGTEVRSHSSLVRVLPHSKVWAWVFEKKADGSYVRAVRALDALRKRSKAYRLAGCVSTACAELAVGELQSVMDAQEGKKV